MHLVPRAYEGYWSQDTVASLFRQAALPVLSKSFWHKGYQHLYRGGLSYGGSLQRTLCLMDPYGSSGAQPIDLMKYDSQDLIFVESHSDVDLIDGLHMAPAPVWSVERRFNYTSSQLDSYDAEHQYYAYHIQTVDTAQLEVPDQFYATVTREDDDSFRFVCRLYGKEETNKVYRELMKVS